jgi:hypothetical protein
MSTTMKKIYILAAGFIALLAAACNKDDSTGAGPVVTLKVSGLKDTFNVYTHRDFLKIAPAVQNEGDFDFYWTLFSTSITANQGLVKPDTLARTKDLNYEVLKAPGAYILVFNARDKGTGIVRQVNMMVNITTLTMNGWYLVKDNGGKTDMDFIHSAGRIDNWIAFFNEGKSLDGDYVSAQFTPQLKPTATSQINYNGIMLASKNDAAIYRVDNGSMVMNFDNMFFTKPATRKPQAVFQPISTNQVGFINDGKAYVLVKGTLFANLPLTYNSINYGNLSPLVTSVAQDLGWDPVRKSIFCYSGSYYTELRASNGGNKLQNVNGNLQWMAGYTGSRSVALLLFRNPQDSGYLYKVNGSYGPVATGSGTLIMNADTLSPQHGLMHASVIGGNYDVDLIYYAVGDKIKMTDVASATEVELFQLPAGETVTAIQHIKYPQSVGTPPPTSTVNYIAIATYKAGRYKVYLHTISGTGAISSVTLPSFEGDGRVSNVIYMEQGNGTRTF